MRILRDTTLHSASVSARTAATRSSEGFALKSGLRRTFTLI